MSKAAELAALIGSQSALSNRNLIINGAAVIDQRNSGAAITSSGYVVDRFHYQNDSDATLSLQQSSTVPDNFANSISVTVSTADASVGAAQYSMLTQRIEGYNIANLGWGTSAAKTVTLSFYVRSSVTGTFGGVLNNSDSSRSYPFTYSISSADTWEKKTVTVEGDTSGTWNTTNSSGIQLRWAFGMGSTYAGTAGSWSGNSYFGASGAVDLISTVNATWYITGVQLEVGEQATPFEHRSYGDELARCQRYFFQMREGSGEYTQFAHGRFYSTSAGNALVRFPAPMRANPTLTSLGSAGDYDFSPTNTPQSGQVTTAGNTAGGTSDAIAMAVGNNFSGVTSGAMYILGGNGGTGGPAGLQFDAEL